jgi:hypothetical protein
VLIIDHFPLRSGFFGGFGDFGTHGGGGGGLAPV